MPILKVNFSEFFCGFQCCLDEGKVHRQSVMLLNEWPRRLKCFQMGSDNVFVVVFNIS